MKKEPLSIMTVKTLLAVVIFTGIGTIIISGGWLIGKQEKVLDNTPVLIPGSSEWCNNLDEKINDKTGKMNKSCQSNEDCKVGEILAKNKLGGSYTVCMNKNENVEEINELKKLYSKKCERFLPEIIFSITPFYGCKCENNACKEVQEQEIEEVIITTDKMEYEQGETIQITVKNGLSENVCFESCNTYFFQKKNVVWKEYLTKRCEVNFITECIGYPKIKEFEGILSEVNFEKGVYRIAFPIYTGCQNKEFPCEENKTIYSNEFTIKEKSALDPRCSEKVIGIVLHGASNVLAIGYEYDLEVGKCVKKTMSGCSVQTPFETLEECQEVCEKDKDICMNEDDECTVRDIDCCDGLKKAPLIYEKETEECGVVLPCGSICIPCGNGICDRRENKCNCPEDCK